MGNSESRPSPGEDRHRGSHGGNRSARELREDETVRSSQAAGKDPGRESTPMRIPPEERVVRGPRRNPVSDSEIERRPPNWESHERGWRAGDPAADSVMPGREFGAGGGVDDGPNEAGGDAAKSHPR
ncbi:hypothetical protein [Brevundimonas sp.]|uniref:hypothetical protein n=1 Tax=Brevundimonas sp. TaxID=1871086 RepID=UPI002D67315F|nr:hypothetical protein [Brevundimonas sp.]HYC75234.1 hypothetical protein [Brevundimonas sp.]